MRYQPWMWVSCTDYHPHRYDKVAYKGRNVIERMFCRLKDLPHRMADMMPFPRSCFVPLGAAGVMLRGSLRRMHATRQNILRCILAVIR